MADIQTQISEARKAGYDDAAIAVHLTGMPEYGSKMKTALDAGYEPTEILSYLTPSAKAPDSEIPIPAKRRATGQEMPPVAAPSLYQRALGVAEVVPGMLGGVVGGVVAPVAGLVSSLTSGKFGTREGAAAGEQTVKRVQEMLAYKPVTQPGAENIQAVGEALAPLVGIPLPTINALARTSSAPIRLATNALRGEAELVGGAVSNLAKASTARKVAAQQTDIARNAVRNQTLEEGQALGLKVTPGSVTPSIQNVSLERLGGKTRLESQIQTENTPVFDNIARRAIDLPENTTPLETSTTLAVRAEEFQKGYAPLMQAGQIASDNTFTSTMQNIAGKYTGPSRSFPGAVPETVSKAIDTYSVPTFDAADALTASAKLREEAASNFRKGENGVAKAQREIATALEDQIERHLTATGTPNATAMLAQFRASRTRMAISHTIEDSIVEGSGSIDPRKWAADIQAGKLLTGEMEAAAKFANTFKNAVKTPGTGGTAGAQQGLGLGSGLRGTAGAIVGGVLSGGNPFAMGLSAIAPEMASAAARRYLASPLGQRRALPKYARGARVNELAPDQPPQVNTLPVPYVSQGPIITAAEAPNWVYGRPDTAPPAVNVGLPDYQGPRQLAAPSSEATMANLAQQRASQLANARSADVQAARVAEAESAAARLPTGRGTVLEVDPNTGGLRAVAPTPTTLAPTSLQSAINKLSGVPTAETQTAFRKVYVGRDAQGAPKYVQRQVAQTVTQGENTSQAPTLTAVEKIAWDRAKATLEEVLPGFNKLSDTQVFQKLLDRQWIADTIKKSREKEAMWAGKAAAEATTDRQIAAATEAAAKHTALMDLGEALETRLRGPRPVAKSSQGPKTRAAQRLNQLATQESQNRLAAP